MNDNNNVIVYKFRFSDYSGFGKQEPTKEIKDNEYHYIYNFEEFDEEGFDDVLNRPFNLLKTIKRVLIKEKKRGHSNVLVINKKKNNDENEEEEGIFPYKLDEYNRSVQTDRYVGVIKYRDKQNAVEATVEIGSRFDKGHSQFFLTYLMSKAFDGTIFTEFSPNYSSDKMWEMLLFYLFSLQLIEAYRQGLFKTFHRLEYNDPRMKGNVDAQRHMKYNIPFMGNIAYSTREHTFDNPILHLIRHTFDRLQNKYPDLMDYFKGDRTEWSITKIKRIINEVTPTYNSMNVQDILFKTSRKINHPFFTLYEPLRKTCRMILKDCGLNVYDGDQKQQVYGIMIDISWLWENFVGKEILCPLGFRSGEVEPLLKDVQKNEIVKNRKFDYVKKGFMVIDAKYKPKWQNFDFVTLSADINQVITYILVANVMKGGVIFPSSLTDLKVRDYRIMIDPQDIDHQYRFHTIPLVIPNNYNSSDDFKKEMNGHIKKLRDQIVGIKS